MRLDTRPFHAISPCKKQQSLMRVFSFLTVEKGHKKQYRYPNKLTWSTYYYFW